MILQVASNEPYSEKRGGDETATSGGILYMSGNGCGYPAVLILRGKLCGGLDSLFLFKKKTPKNIEMLLQRPFPIENKINSINIVVNI